MDKEDNYYESRMDKIFGKSSFWKHRTLRTIFDPFSSEWADTDFFKKKQILRQIIESGEDLEQLIWEYKERYEEQKRKDIANSVEDALIRLLVSELKEKPS